VARTARLAAGRGAARTRKRRPSTAACSAAWAGRLGSLPIEDCSVEAGEADLVEAGDAAQGRRFEHKHGLADLEHSLFIFSRT
jgi:hypothetical protein